MCSTVTSDTDSEVDELIASYENEYTYINVEALRDQLAMSTFKPVTKRWLLKLLSDRGWILLDDLLGKRVAKTIDGKTHAKRKIYLVNQVTFDLKITVSEIFDAIDEEEEKHKSDEFDEL